MRIDRVELRLVRLPLGRTFRTSSSTKDHIDHILIRAFAEGLEGWGECASPSDPYYCPETTGTCWHILEEFLAPRVLGREWASIEEFVALFGPIKGNRFARAGIEIAAWDLLAQARGVSLAKLLGGASPEILSGVSLGIEPDIPALLEQVDRHVAEGYRRVKLKIAPGWDVGPVEAVRARYPDLPLQVDANSAYRLDDMATFRQLDGFGLLLIEQPLAHDDIIDHAQLQAQLRTDLCLDESIHTVDDARHALALGSCRVINIKVSRVGGPLEAVRIHDDCQARGVPVWCGGMHEFGIGRAANIAVASLPGFTLPGDISGSDKYYREDLVEPPIVANQGAVAVPQGVGLGHRPLLERIERHTLRTATLGT
jgi:O-succinylbenzoate synthase